MWELLICNNIWYLQIVKYYLNIKYFIYEYNNYL